MMIIALRFSREKVFDLSEELLWSPAMKSEYDVVSSSAPAITASWRRVIWRRAGLSVLMLEKNDYIGGATTSQQVFPDYDAYPSRYSYLVSLFPEKIIRDLGLNLELRRRATGILHALCETASTAGLLLSNVSEDASAAIDCSNLTGNDSEHEQLKTLLLDFSRAFAEQTWDTMFVPLAAKEDFRRRLRRRRRRSRKPGAVSPEEPIGAGMERHQQNDLLRGLVLTYVKIGVFTDPHDPSLLQNRCFLYHLIGNKTGEWKVPVGGMGNVVRELERAARKGGAEMLTNVNLHRLDLNGQSRRSSFELDGKRRRSTPVFSW